MIDAISPSLLGDYLEISIFQEIECFFFFFFFEKSNDFLKIDRFDDTTTKETNDDEVV